MSSRYPPGPDTTFLHAMYSTFRQQRDRLGYLVDIAQNYGDMVHFHTGLRHIYLVTDPELVHRVLVAQADQFYKTRPVKRAFGHFIGRGLLTVDGEAHQHERRLAQPAFHHQRVEAYAEVMVERTTRVIDQWQKGGTYFIDREMMKITLGIVAKTLFDADVEGDAATVGRAMSVLQEGVMRRFRALVDIPYWIPTRQNQIEQQAIKSLDTIIFKIIAERRQSGEDKGDLLSMLLLARDEEGCQFTIQQVRDEVITLFLTGHESTANCLMWTWYLLTQYPDVWVKLQSEVDDVLGGRAATFQDLSRLTYTNKVFKEALRLYPPVWVITRESIADVEIGAYSLKKGSVVVTSPYIAQRDPRYFPQPDEFQPERFTEGWEKTMPRFAYFPFGGGPRVCIGQSFALMEATLILATIAQRYRLHLAPQQSVVLDPLITLRAKHGIQMQVESRQP